MRILGVSAYYHDSAAALIEDGRVIAAAQEERFTRRKHDASFPTNAVNYCLSERGVPISSLDAVVFYEKPFLKFERLLETYMSVAPRGFRQFLMAMPIWLREKLFQKISAHQRVDEDRCRLRPGEAAVQRAPSEPCGERLLSFAVRARSHPHPRRRRRVDHDRRGSRRRKPIELLKEMQFPHSLGLLYSAFTYYTGFKVNSGEYKLMGLAPYGKPVFAGKILEHLDRPEARRQLSAQSDLFRLYDRLHHDQRPVRGFVRRAGARSGGALTTFHMDVAASIQAVTEEIVLRLTRSLAAETGEPNLCLAGGVALNCVANGKVLRDKHFKRIWVQPAAGDAGGAVGAALAAYHMEFAQTRETSNALDGMAGAYLGPAYES